MTFRHARKLFLVTLFIGFFQINLKAYDHTFESWIQNGEKTILLNAKKIG